MSAASAVGNELHYLAYYYGRFGNLDSQTMESNNGAMSVTESYSYDDLHRLTGSSLSSGGSISYSYDATGNLTQKSDYASSMSYGSSGKSNTGNAGPNAVLSATLVGGGSTSFSYDNNGNLISGAGKTISYNALNKPTQVTAGGSTVNFAYDANWQRFKKTVSGNRTVYYIDDSVEVEQVDDTTITRTYIDDIAIVKRTKYAGLSLASHEITYTLRDRLGSVVTLTDHNNHILEHRSYDPFGKPRYGTMLPSSAATLFDVAGGTPFTLRGFTDHEHIDEAQLIHMNGRVYDYNLGRFLSIDPFVQAPGNSQSLNPYSYIMNNPLAGTDPSGYALVQGSIDCDESMAACVTVLNGGTPTKNDFSGAAASNGSAPSNDGSDSDVEAEELGAPGEVGWNITAVQYATLSSLAADNRRTEYYLALYEMTNSNLAIQMAQISSNSGFLGGVAWEANQQIKEDFGGAYPGTIENFSIMVFKNDFAQITANGEGGFNVPTDLEMTRATINLWKSVGLGDVAPPQVLLDNLEYGMAGGAAISTVRVPQAMGYVGAATYNEIYGNQRGVYKVQFMQDHPDASVSYTQDGRFMVISGDKVYTNINVHPTKDLVVYPTFQ